MVVNLRFRKLFSEIIFDLSKRAGNPEFPPQYLEKSLVLILYTTVEDQVTMLRLEVDLLRLVSSPKDPPLVNSRTLIPNIFVSYGF